MLFATNRVLQEGPTPKPSENGSALPRSINFNLRNNQAEQSIYFCRRERQDQYTEIGNQAFFQALKEHPAKQILLYIHGFSSLPESGIFATAETLQRLCDQKQPNQVLVVPIIWPCDSDVGMVKDYFDDQMAADASDISFARMFEKFLNWRETGSTQEQPCVKPINVLAHSMGNRVLRGAIARTIDYFQPQGFPLIFRNIFMAAADVANNTLDLGQQGEYISHASRNTVVYFAEDDLAMRASKVANMSIAVRRLGHTGPEQMTNVRRNVYGLDCNDFNNTYDRPAGHGYFTTDNQGNPGLVFDHLWECMRTGRVPMLSSQPRVTILRDRFWLRP